MTPGPAPPATAGSAVWGGPCDYQKTRGWGGASSEAPGGPNADQVPGCPNCSLPTQSPSLSLGDQRDQPVPLWPPATTWANNDPFRSLALASWAGCQGQ